MILRPKNNPELRVVNSDLKIELDVNHILVANKDFRREVFAVKRENRRKPNSCGRSG